MAATTGTIHRSELERLARDELAGLRALARRLTRAEAEDLVQESLLRACRSFHSLRDPVAAPAWLRSILINVWRDRVRTIHARPREIPTDGDDASAPRDVADLSTPPPFAETLHVDSVDAFSAHDVRVLLDQLPDRYRLPLVLRYLHGWSTHEIAGHLDLPLGTVLSQLHRGRERLARALRRYAEEADVGDLGEREGMVASEGRAPVRHRVDRDSFVDSAVSQPGRGE
ncbi:RNA polymerase sigma factor [Egibacter rhizosphaerae]|uniref:RNA polymerase sigma factor n=1 Tax=Egibacter rhizosphaerae TaxID=1670831 RepID=UPI0013F172DC|nr:RNA polymerase sigma factor [Egibacter rhizosphaerae]